MIETIYKVFVPAGLMVLMFGMGLQLVAADWMRLVRYPAAVLAGLIGQILVLPAIAFLLIGLVPLPLAVSAGIIILAACPGGVVSNSISYLARADVALSVTLTAFSSVLALLTVPVLVGIGLNLIQNPGTGSVSPAEIHLPLGGTIRQLLVMVLLPLSLGMLVRRFKVNFAVSADRWLRPGSVVVLVILLVGAVGLEFEFFVSNFRNLWFVLLVLNIAAMVAGYLLARLFRLNGMQQRTVAIEVGIQNVALGVMIALNILNRPEWMVVPSVYSIVMMLTSFALVAVINLRTAAGVAAEE